MIKRAFRNARSHQDFSQSDTYKTFIRDQAFTAIEDVIFGGGLIGCHTFIIQKVDRSSTCVGFNRIRL